MSPKEFPFPKGEDASTNSSSPPEGFYKQPVQPVPLITHIPDPPQQFGPVVYNPEPQPQPQPQPQQTVPAYRPQSRQQFRTQPLLTTPASRSASRQQPQGARQQSFVSAYSPASRQQQYLPDPQPTSRTPSPTRQQQHRPEPQQHVAAATSEERRQSIPTYMLESRQRQPRVDPGRSGGGRSPDPPRAGQATMRTPLTAQSSDLLEQIAFDRRPFETERRTIRHIEPERRTVETERGTVEPERRTVEPERRPIRPIEPERRPIRHVEPERRSIETERRPIDIERRSTDTERRSTDTQRRRVDSVHATPTKPISQKRSPSRQPSARERYRATSSGTETEEQHNRLLRSRKQLTNTPRTRSYIALTDNDDEKGEISLGNRRPSSSRPVPRRVSSGSASDLERRGGRGKPRGLSFHEARTYMSSGRRVRSGDWDAGQPQVQPAPTTTPSNRPSNPHSPTTPPRLPIPISVHPSRPPSPPTPISTETGKMNNHLGWALFLNSGIKNHLVATLGELIGTTMFLFFAFAGTVVANINSPSSEGLTTTGLTTGWNVTKLLYVAFSFGFSLMVNVWIFFRISGGLFNPAVTLALLLTGAIGFVRALFLFFAQILGSIAASGLIVGLFPAAANVRTTLSSGLSIPKGLFIEAFLTAELVFTILMLAKEKHKATFIAPVGIGLALFIAELVGVYWTGGSLNPARSIGPSIVTWTWDKNHWIYWLGPALGSLVAVGFYALIKALEYELANPGQDSDSATSPGLERAVQTRQEQVRRRVMGAMGYDVVDGRASVEYDQLGKSEMGLMKPGLVYVKDGVIAREGAGFGGGGGGGGPGMVVGERDGAYVAGHGRGGSAGSGTGGYAAGGGSAPHFGPLGTSIRDSAEIGQEEGLSVRDMEYETGASGRKQHGKREE